MPRVWIVACARLPALAVLVALCVVTLADDEVGRAQGNAENGATEGPVAPSGGGFDRVARGSRRYRPPPSAAEFTMPGASAGAAWPSDFRMSDEEQAASNEQGADALTSCCAFFPFALLASVLAAFYFGPIKSARLAA